MKKQINIFKSVSTLTKKQIIAEKSQTNKAVNTVLADFASSLEMEYLKLIKSKEQRVRNLANALKGKYSTVVNVVAACYPYQTEDGLLCVKVTPKDEDGNKLPKIWGEKKLTRAAASGIIRECTKNYTNTLGNPEVVTVVVGATVAE